MKKQCRFDLLRDERGGSLVEAGLLMPIFLMLLLGAFDFGMAYHTATEVAGAAQAAALYGALQPTDTVGMTNAAKDDAPNVSNLTVQSITNGCECSDGSQYSANCGTTPSCGSLSNVNRVIVTVTASYTTVFPWPGIPSSIPLTSTASMRSR